MERVGLIITLHCSHFCIAVFIYPTQLDRAARLIEGLMLPERVRIILYLATPELDPPGLYPVNKLRNIAIVNIQTTHFLVLDMDMWPARRGTERMRCSEFIFRIDASSLLSKGWKLYGGGRSCFFFAEGRDSEQLHHNSWVCHFVCSLWGLLTKRSSNAFPTNKAKLLKCLDKKKCLVYKKNTKTHRYITDMWKYVPSKLHYAKLLCFMNRFQEPSSLSDCLIRSYVLLRFTRHTILFDERFVNYGCNKVQFIDHLRNAGIFGVVLWIVGYRFYILTQSFAMDIVHHE